MYSLYLPLEGQKEKRRKKKDQATIGREWNILSHTLSLAVFYCTAEMRPNLARYQLCTSFQNSLHLARHTAPEPYS